MASLIPRGHLCVMDKQSAKIFLVLSQAGYQKHLWSYLKLYFLQTIYIIIEVSDLPSYTDYIVDLEKQLILRI